MGLRRASGLEASPGLHREFDVLQSLQLLSCVSISLNWQGGTLKGEMVLSQWARQHLAAKICTCEKSARARSKHERETEPNRSKRIMVGGLARSQKGNPTRHRSSAESKCAPSRRRWQRSRGESCLLNTHHPVKRRRALVLQGSKALSRPPAGGSGTGLAADPAWQRLFPIGGGNGAVSASA